MRDDGKDKEKYILKLRQKMLEAARLRNVIDKLVNAEKKTGMAKGK